MEIQLPYPQLRSLQPVQSLNPIYTIQKYASHKTYRAQCMIPFSTYSIKVVYIIKFIAFKVFVQIQVYVIPMVFPQFFAVQNDPSMTSMLNISKEALNPISIANYSFNCFFCVRCNLGISCQTHVPPPRKLNYEQEMIK